MTEFTAVGMTLSLPPDESDAMNNFDLLDKPVPSGGSEPTAPWVWVTPGYFATLNIPSSKAACSPRQIPVSARLSCW